ncbi:MAG: hypothetical protein R3F14_12625 [Polyangiaceae bacterium]
MKKVDGTAIGVVGCLGVLLVALVAAAIAVVIWVRGRVAEVAEEMETERTDAAEDAGGPPRRPGEALAVEPCAFEPGTGSELSEPLRVHDPARVDLAELYDQVAPLVRRLEPNAKVTTISALREAADGAFDSAEGNFSFNFEYRCLRAGMPPGKDLVQGMLLGFVQGGIVRASRVPVPHAPTLERRGGLPEPPCSTVAAWTTAVATGVPANARATFLYMEATGSRGGASWLIGVPGHDEYKREVDGTTCRLHVGSAIHPGLRDPGVALPELHPKAKEAAEAPPAEPSAEPSGAPSGEPSVQPSGAAEAPGDDAPGARPATPDEPPVHKPAPPATIATAQETRSGGGQGCSLSVNAIPPSRVFIDGKARGQTPMVHIALPCGAHRVTFEHAQHGKKSVSITLKPGSPGMAMVKF